MSDTAKIEMAREICAIISEAVMAERERCAKLAERLPMRSCQPFSFEDIAAAIRAGEMP